MMQQGVDLCSVAVADGQWDTPANWGRVDHGWLGNAGTCSDVDDE